MCIDVKQPEFTEPIFLAFPLKTEIKVKCKYLSVYNTMPRAGRHDTGQWETLSGPKGYLEAKGGRASQLSVCGKTNRVIC